MMVALPHQMGITCPCSPSTKALLSIYHNTWERERERERWRGREGREIQTSVENSKLQLQWWLWSDLFYCQAWSWSAISHFLLYTQIHRLFCFFEWWSTQFSLNFFWVFKGIYHLSSPHIVNKNKRNKLPKKITRETPIINKKKSVQKLIEDKVLQPTHEGTLFLSPFSLSF